MSVLTCLLACLLACELACLLACCFVGLVVDLFVFWGVVDWCVVGVAFVVDDDHDHFWLLVVGCWLLVGG